VPLYSTSAYANVQMAESFRSVVRGHFSGKAKKVEAPKGVQDRTQIQGSGGDNDWSISKRHCGHSIRPSIATCGPEVRRAEIVAAKSRVQKGFWGAFRRSKAERGPTIRKHDSLNVLY